MNTEIFEHCTASITFIFRHLSIWCHKSIVFSFLIHIYILFQICIVQLTLLNVLDLHIYGQSASNLMEAIAESGIQLEDSTLKDVTIDISGIHSICKIESLKKIHFVDFYAFDLEYLVSLVQGFPLLSSLDVEYPDPDYGTGSNAMDNRSNLKNLILHGRKLSNLSILHSNCTEFGLHDYEEILTIIQNRQEKIGLKIIFGCNDDRYESFERQTELENGERFEVSVNFYG